MEREFRVIVKTFRGYSIEPREKAIKRAKQMISDIIEDGFGEGYQWARFEHELTLEHLGMIRMENGVAIGDNLDMRIATIKALLA